ncbi:hypothetical protein HUI56_004992 [Escherichia coli]|nr:hypothetical protein [Escherichia coli]
MKDFLKVDTEQKNLQIVDNVIIDENLGEVVIGANTRICHGAVIQGPVVIGANCLIGNYAFIRPSTVISNSVKVGFATEIKNSVIESEVTIGPRIIVERNLASGKYSLRQELIRTGD